MKASTLKRTLLPERKMALFQANKREKPPDRHDDLEPRRSAGGLASSARASDPFGGGAGLFNLLASTRPIISLLAVVSLVVEGVNWLGIHLLGWGCLSVGCRCFQRKCLSKNRTTRCLFDDDGKIESACPAPGM
jgi:hypothetical protein